MLLSLFICTMCFNCRNVNEAKKIHSLAEQARNTTIEAYNFGKKAIAKYSNMTYVIILYSREMILKQCLCY